jgi:hypothetical protein
MPRCNIYLDDIENEILKPLIQEWNISKEDTIKRIIREYKKKKI